MPIVEVGENPLFYFEYRTSGPSTPPVLLIHGAGGQHVHWPPQVRRLPGVRTIAPDLPGHGKSGGGGCDTVSGYAADLLALMDALGIQRFVAVGHSMGGAVAQVLALDAPQRVAGLALVSTGARLRVAPQILDNLPGNLDAVADFVNTYAYGPSASDDLRRVGRRALKETPPLVAQRDYAACNVFDVTDRLGEIVAPVLVVCGDHDQMTPLKYSEYLATNIPGAELVVVEGAGHMLPSEFPGALADILNDWLERTFGDA